MIRRTHKARVSRPVFDAPDPIDAYLDALWLSLRNQADRNDLVAEAEGHLREAVERQVASGTEPSAAHELALREFGDAALVARALVRTRLHTVPRPTPATRAAGRLGKWAGIAWLLAVATYVYQLCSNPWLAERYLLFQVVAGMATLLTSVLMFGLFARTGAARSPRLMLALPVTLLTLAGNTVFTWMWSITNLQLALTLWLALLETLVAMPNPSTVTKARTRRTPPAPIQPIGAHSGPVSASLGSSLVKIGDGLFSGVPTAIGVERHTACWLT